MDSRKSTLNLPAGMESSLRLNTIPTHFPSIPKTPSPSKTTYSDRFIPLRSASRLQNFALVEKSSPVKEGGNEAYSRLLRTELFGADSVPCSPAGQGSPMSPSKNLFRFKTDHSAPNSPLSAVISGQDGGGSAEASMPPKVPRKIPKTAYKVTKLCDLGNRDGVCAVQWTREGSYLAVGTYMGDVQIWDSSRCKQIRTMGGHQTRTGVLAWSSCMLSSGSRDKHILQHDIRVSKDYVSKLVGHRSEVCGLKWSHDDRELASGGNDNQLLVWNQHSQQPVTKFTEHTAAIKAIAWSPHQSGLLASGGGTADRCIRFWNTTNKNMLKCVDSGSQVCNLAWCKNVNELVSTHGYSQNQIMIWKYPSLGKVATLTGHTLRVLYLATSPDGQTIVTGAGDETLRFWNVFPSAKTPVVRDSGVWSLGRTHIR
ncbi:protein FIZZY-RELATED 3 isoform X2 [Phoenix dactylifera]|uniref:Protein FIZZY-RELATED 3 isoform X2 n=1 Tax=Phoenix dactylifera TaxID=42345 RepID=A0A8B9A2Y6_PHODC|nr:protein FIZZY-RELATED 3 isoform X2 [Phoenix dactylifera]